MRDDFDRREELRDYLNTSEREKTVSVNYEPSHTDNLSREVGDSVLDGQAAFTDMHAQQETHAGRRNAVGGSTFYADEGDDAPLRKGWDYLWKINSGNDKLPYDSGNPRHKPDKNTRIKRETAEKLCDVAGLTDDEREEISSKVGNTDLTAFTYLAKALDEEFLQEIKESELCRPATEIFIVGLITLTIGRRHDNPLEHEGVKEVAELVGVDDVEYVCSELRKKLDGW